jgi:hypothetical protein
MFGATERLTAFGARTFNSAIIVSMAKDLKEKKLAVDFIMR